MPGLPLLQVHVQGADDEKRGDIRTLWAVAALLSTETNHLLLKTMLFLFLSLASLMPSPRMPIFIPQQNSTSFDLHCELHISLTANTPYGLSPIVPCPPFLPCPLALSSTVFSCTGRVHSRGELPHPVVWAQCEQCRGVLRLHRLHDNVPERPHQPDSHSQGCIVRPGERERHAKGMDERCGGEAQGGRRDSCISWRALVTRWWRYLRVGSGST